MKRLTQPNGYFDDPILKGSFAVFAGVPGQEAEDWYSDVIGEEPRPMSDGTTEARFTFVDRKCGGVLWFRDRFPVAATVAHECVHAALWVYAFRECAPVHSRDDEAFASYVEYLVREVGKVLAKPKKRRVKRAE